jgi:copper transport protein
MRTLGATALLFVVAVAPAAWAHAGLVSSDPADGATLEAAPAAITLVFTETPDLGLSSIEVVDAGGSPVRVGTPGAVGDHGLAATLPSDLGDGVYTVAWGVVSTEDGHKTEGTFAFGVGQTPPPPGSGGQVAVTGPSPLSVAAKAAFYAGTMVLVAIAVVALGVFGGRPRSLRVLALVAGPVAFAGAIGMLVAEQRALGVDAGELLDAAAGRPYVQLLALTLIAAGFAVLGAARPGWRWLLWLGASAAAAAMFVRASSGHAAAAEPPLPQELAQWLHMLAAAVWIGGLVLLAMLLREPDDPPPGAVRRYSNVAVAAVGVVVATGFARTWNELGGPLGLARSLDTSYGLTLAIKVTVAIAIVAIGAVNRYRSIARLESDRAPLRRLLRVELLAAAGVVLLTATLTGLDPSAGAVVEIPRSAIIGHTEGTDFATTTRVRLTLEPGTAGPNTFRAQVVGADDGVPLPADAVSIRATSITVDGLPPADLDLAPAGDGWVGDATTVSVAGTWDVVARVIVGADAVEVPMVLVTRSGATDPPTPGSRSATARYPSGTSVQLGLEITTPDVAFVHVTALAPDGTEVPLRSVVIVATRDGSETVRIEPELASAGHAFTELSIGPGSWTIDTVSTTRGGDSFQATLADVPIA